MTSRLRRTQLFTVAVTMCAAAILWTGAGARAAALQGAGRSVWDGVYSEAQSKRGEQVYSDTCANCHAEALTGSAIVPALVGEDFLTKWNGSVAGDLFETIRTTMPQDKPESLTPAQVADVLAFMFSKNRMPSGKSDLAATFEALKTIRLEPSKKP